jgi:hypothetical protein
LKACWQYRFDQTIVGGPQTEVVKADPNPQNNFK